MRIRYTGSRLKRRLVAGYEWSRAAGWVQDVPASLAVELLTTPEDEFVVAADAEPLTGLHGVGPQRAAELALAGIGSLTDLAALDEDGIARLAEGIWASARQVEGWVAAARAAPAQDGGNES